MRPKLAKQDNPQNIRIDDNMINFFGELSPRFAEWYRASYNSEGRYVGERIPGLFGQS